MCRLQFLFGCRAGMIARTLRKTAVLNPRTALSRNGSRSGTGLQGDAGGLEPAEGQRAADRAAAYVAGAGRFGRWSMTISAGRQREGCELPQSRLKASCVACGCDRGLTPVTSRDLPEGYFESPTAFVARLRLRQASTANTMAARSAMPASVPTTAIVLSPVSTSVMVFSTPVV